MDRPILSRLATAATYFLITLFGMGLILFAPEMSKAASDGLFMCLTMYPLPVSFFCFILTCHLHRHGAKAFKSLCAPYVPPFRPAGRMFCSCHIGPCRRISDRGKDGV